MIKVEKGDFSCQFHSSSSDELADLGNSFNHMTTKLDALFKRTQTQQQKLLEQDFCMLGDYLARHAASAVDNNKEQEAER